jgi:hypothetical protein
VSSCVNRRQKKPKGATGNPKETKGPKEAKGSIRKPKGARGIHREVYEAIGSRTDPIFMAYNAEICRVGQKSPFFRVNCHNSLLILDISYFKILTLVS